jgi:multidrug efflux system outer membrane protein
VDFQTVLETQRSQLSTQDSLATATADVSADHVRLFKALGGGWMPDDRRHGAHASPNPASRR